jgi:hypothetical protein
LPGAAARDHFVVVPIDHWHDVATNQQQQKVIVQLQVID